MKTAGDALSGMMLRMELCEGKAAHDSAKYFERQDRPHTTATTIRLVDEWFGTDRVVYGDSWFASVKTVKALLDNGLETSRRTTPASQRMPWSAPLLRSAGLGLSTPQSSTWMATMVVVAMGTEVQALHSFVSSQRHREQQLATLGTAFLVRHL